MFEVYPDPETVKFTSPLPKKEFFTEIPLNANVLEIGCGYGRILRHMFTLGFRNLYGIDPSPKLIQRAKKKFPFAKYQVGTLKEFTGNRLFNVVLICGVLEYIIEEADRVYLVQRLSELLVPNGIVCLESFVQDDSLKTDYEYWCGKGYKYGTIVNNSLHLYHVKPDDIDQLFLKSFIKVHSENKVFKTWSNDNANGYTVLYKKTPDGE